MNWNSPVAEEDFVFAEESRLLSRLAVASR